MKKYIVNFFKNEGESETEFQVGKIYKSKWRTEHKFFHYIEIKKIENGLYFPVDGAGREGVPLDDLIPGSYDLALFERGESNAKKPIGKISPNAKWVKQWDEFDEDEIQGKFRLKFKKNLPVLEGTSSIVWANNGAKNISEGIYFKRLEEPQFIPEKSTEEDYCVLNCDKEFMLPRDLVENNTIISVKCSQCETFH